jgi:hypothetical protein
MFLGSLVYADLDQSHLSLINLIGDLQDQHNCSISKVGIHKRFTSEAVNFLKTTFSKLLSEETGIDIKTEVTNSKFNRIRIKDSTKFKLPHSLIDQYPGYRSFNKDTSLMNIQYEFDIKSGDWLTLELTKATRNDQLDSRETVTSIQKNDLCIRDLGYVTMPYLKGVIKEGAFFLNRLPPTLGVYHVKNGKLQPVDWEKVHSLMQRCHLPHLALDVFLDKKMTVKTRMIIQAVPGQIAQKRVKDATIAGKRKDGYTPTKQYRIKSHYNIYITNAPEEMISLSKVPLFYRLRWQIELIFKTWKSLASIDKVKQIKKERFECQLYAKLIWIILNWRLYQVVDHSIKKAEPDEGCSIQKYYNMVNKESFSLRSILAKTKNIKNWLQNVFIPIIHTLKIERKLKKPTHLQILNELQQS